MEKWGLSPDVLKEKNPGLIYTRISGYGQTGPYAPRPGFASVCEAMGGLRYINGFEDRPPARPNISMGDTLAGIHGVMGVLLALLAKSKFKAPPGGGGGGGQVVDVSIYESCFNMLESIIPEYDYDGTIREVRGENTNQTLYSFYLVSCHIARPVLPRFSVLI